MRGLPAFALVAFLGFASSTLVACGSTGANQCNASNCSGCCDSNGQCQSGFAESACGVSGNACNTCQAGLFCQSGFCAPLGSTGNDGGGQGDAGQNDAGQTDGGETDGGQGDGGTDGGGGSCDVASSLAFGGVATGDLVTLTVTVSNPTGAAATATVGDPFSPSGDHSAFVVTSQTGSITVPPMETHSISVAFSPSQLKSYLAFMKVKPAASCPETTVTLSGQGVDSVLSWSPLTVDFGAITPGAEVTREVTFTNVSSADVTLSSLSIPSTDFRIVTPGSTHVVPKNGTLMLTLGFKPGVLGPRQTQLSFNTSASKPASGSIILKGYGGGPDLSVMPTAISFGQVTNTTTATQSVTISNVGTQPPGGTTLTVKLGQAGSPPYFTLTPMGATGPNEFTATLSPAYPSSGLAAGQSTSITVNFTPASSGSKGADLVIHSDDPDEPSTTVTLSGEGVMSVPCSYKVSTNAFNFGLVEPGQFMDLGVVVTNTGTTNCTLSNLALGGTTAADFSLVPGTATTATIPGGQSHSVIVRYAPTGTASALSNVSGSLTFNMSSTTSPSQSVAFSGWKGDSCIITAPDEVDFGTVKTNCGSPTRSIPVDAACGSGITLTGIIMLNAAGQPAGGPNCPGAVACPEFTLVSSPALPQSVFPGSPVTLQVKYKPIDVGADIGSMAINFTQNGQSTYVVIPLFGNGSGTGVNTETFTVPTKSDVVFVMDDSGSMGPYQSAFANASSSFFNYATANAVDYRIGVTTTDNSTGGAQGKFIFGPTHPEKILTPITVNAQTKFAAKVQPGISGSGLEQMFAPMWQSVSYPLTVTDNAGFLRPDSNLSFVLVTDEPDSSPYVASYYYRALRSARGWRHVNRVSFSAAAPIYVTPPPGCSAPPDNGNYEPMVALFGGAQEIICPVSWTVTAQNLGNAAFGQRKQWFLQAIPFNNGGATPTTVKVNGVTVSSGWYWDAMFNAVVFTGTPPLPGDTLTISYGVACL